MPITGWPASFSSSRGSENAQTSQRVVFGGFLHEDGFREIHFAGDGEHLVVGESVAVGDDRERVAFKARGCENVERVEAAFHSDRLSLPEQDDAFRCARAGRRSFR